MRIELSHGYDRKNQVPKIPGTQVKTCTRCNGWFPARKSERACDTCLRPSERAKRFSRLPVPKTAVSGKTASNAAGQRRRKADLLNAPKVIYSELLGLTFTAQPSDPRYARLETIVLAHELAAMERWSEPDDRLAKSTVTPQEVKARTPLVLTKDQASRVTRRNVALSLQGA
jgi:hypothetical protein